MGRSYYHVSQPLGRFISTDEVAGYYNDFTKKADWKGISDDDGIPLNVLSNGIDVYFPITIAQMALGNYDLWLENNENETKDKFLQLAVWLKENQDENGGWSNPWNYLRPTATSNYAGITQGEAISVFTRAYLLTEEHSYLDCSRKAFLLMTKPVEEGGCSFHIKNSIYIEEYPEMPRSTVLNGWIFAIFGIYDLMLITKDEKTRRVFENTIKTLENSIQSYDSGYWSYYDLHGNLASPFYHLLHISLFEALYKLTGTKVFNEFSNKLKGYERRFFNRTRALATKARQKLQNPPEVSIVQ